jgi:hypothetical protein
MADSTISHLAASDERICQLIEQALAARPRISETFKEPKVNSPEPFTGDRTKTRNFLVQVSVVFQTQPSRFPDDQTKVYYLGSFLRGPAASWFSPLVEKQDPILQDWTQFLESFKQTFEHPDRPAEAARQLRALRQGSKSAALLAADFRRIAVDVEWTTSSLMDTFYDALNDRVKDRLAELERPKTLAEYIEMAIRIDDCQVQRLNEKRHAMVPSQPLRRQFTPPVSNRPTQAPVFTPGFRYATSSDSGPVPMQLQAGQHEVLGSNLSEDFGTWIFLTE